MDDSRTVFKAVVAMASNCWESLSQMLLQGRCLRLIRYQNQVLCMDGKAAVARASDSGGPVSGPGRPRCRLRTNDRMQVLYIEVYTPTCTLEYRFLTHHSA
jgi:hypothetical protein